MSVHTIDAEDSMAPYDKAREDPLSKIENATYPEGRA